MNSYIRKKIRIYLLTFFNIVFFTCAPSYASDKSMENKLKALYIVRIAEFIEWPETTEKTSFKLCIAENSPIFEQLQLLQIDTINKLPLHIIALNKDTALLDCQILYSEKEKAEVSIIQHPILTISSELDFARQGGMIEFYIDKSKVRMKANLEAFALARLKPSSKLIRLLTIVTTAEQKQ